VSAIDMNIHRLDVEERRMGLRGITEDLRVPRSVAFRFTGFGKKQTPALELPISTPDGILAFGRSKARADGGDGDVNLVITDPSGAVDTDQSLQLSRRHFELYVENDKLILRASGGNGLRVNGSALGPDKTVPLQDGDIIEPLVKSPGALKLAVRFTREFDRVSLVTVTRTPAIQESAA
jgi:pSer/pThr/pTyr-binding forkhead associated (FHA) protein